MSDEETLAILKSLDAELKLSAAIGVLVDVAVFLRGIRLTCAGYYGGVPAGTEAQKDALALHSQIQNTVIWLESQLDVLLKPKEPAEQQEGEAIAATKETVH